jgi:hypothetical protein
LSVASGLCDGPITHPEESYRLWCTILCDLENLRNEKAKTPQWVAMPVKKYNLARCLVSNPPMLYLMQYNIFEVGHTVRLPIMYLDFPRNSL